MTKTAPLGFSILYISYVLFAILFPSITIGNISLRHILTVLLLVPCLLNMPKHIDWFLLLYCIYLLFVLNAGISTGYKQETVSLFLSTYIAGIVLYMSTTIMIVKYYGIKHISILLLVVFILDAIVTIGQYYGVSFLTVLPQIMGLNLGENYKETIGMATMQAGSNLYGLVGPTANGYLLSAAAIIAWYPFKTRTSAINISLSILFLIASFFTQERAGFYLAVFFTVFITLVKFRTSKGLSRLLIVVVIIIIALFGESLFDFVMSSGRYASKGMDDGGRIEYFNEFLSFIKENPSGGYNLYYNTHYFIPHNIIANAYVTGGIIGGSILLLIIIIQLVIIGRFIFTTNKTLNWLPFLFCLMYVCYTAQSFVHNRSLAYGTPLFFVFWGVSSCFAENKLEISDHEID